MGISTVMVQFQCSATVPEKLTTSLSGLWQEQEQGSVRLVSQCLKNPEGKTTLRKRIEAKHFDQQRKSTACKLAALCASLQTGRSSMDGNDCTCG